MSSRFIILISKYRTFMKKKRPLKKIDLESFLMVLNKFKEISRYSFSQTIPQREIEFFAVLIFTFESSIISYSFLFP